MLDLNIIKEILVQSEIDSIVDNNNLYFYPLINNNLVKVQARITSEKINYISDTTIESIHLVNILNKKYDSGDKIIDMINFLQKGILTDYCLICGNELMVKTSDHITCGNKECMIQSEEIIIGNYILNKLKQFDNYDGLKLMIQLAKYAANSPRKEQIFDPYPIFLSENKQVEINQRGELKVLKNINYYKNYNLIENITKNLLNTLDNIMDNLDMLNDDNDLCKKVGKKEYLFLKFILSVSHVNIYKTQIINIKVDQYEIKYLSDNNKKVYGHLFHGSSIENWYSILCNGVKILSGTKLMTSGKAYGNGIYLSDDVNLSLNYSKNGNMLGVFEIYDDISKYKKSSNIFVIDNEDILKLKYLIKLSNKNEYCKSINNHFITQVNTQHQSIRIKTTSKGQRRLMIEYKKLVNNNENGFSIELINNDLYHWRVKIYDFDKSYKIAQDCEQYGIENIELEVIFESTYPFHPPFVRIISPRFKYMTGHITSGGSICMELLTPQGWTSVCSMESLIIQIKTLIIEGNGRLDPDKYKENYKLDEAKNSFLRVARGHGWL